MDPIVVVDPPPSTSSAFSMRTMLDMVFTVQAARGQLLLDLLNKVATLWADLADARGSTPPSNES